MASEVDSLEAEADIIDQDHICWADTNFLGSKLPTQFDYRFKVDRRTRFEGSIEAAGIISRFTKVDSVIQMQNIIIEN